jgi:hypothetical protein
MASINSCVPLPDKDYLLSILFYDHESGKITWNRKKNPQFNGMEAGNQVAKGYRRIKINRRLYLAHRIAYLLAYDVDPGGFEVDHKDGDPRNNRPGNLRLAIHGRNQSNGVVYKNNKSGFRGVHWNKYRKCFLAQLNCDGRKVNLGKFSTAEDAARAYDAAAIVYFGEFARPNFAREGVTK